jgi:hypothetical protein
MRDLRRKEGVEVCAEHGLGIIHHHITVGDEELEEGKKDWSLVVHLGTWVLYLR